MTLKRTVAWAAAVGVLLACIVGASFCAWFGAHRIKPLSADRDVAGSDGGAPLVARAAVDGPPSGDDPPAALADREDAAAAHAVAGVVVDARGAPIRGAGVVALASRPSERPMSPVRMIRDLPVPRRFAAATTSGADGRFHLDQLPDDSYTVVARLRGHTTAVARAVVVSAGAGASDVRLALGVGHRLVGRVVRPGDGAVGGVPVVAFPPMRPETGWDVDPPDKEMVSTDDDGAFTFESLSEGRWTVFAAPVGQGASDSVEVYLPATPGEEQGVELSLDGTEALTGRVTDAVGAPVGGATVVVGIAGGFLGGTPIEGSATTTTDTDGRYALSGLQPASAETFVVLADGYCVHSHRVDFGGASWTADVTLSRGGTVRGVVVEEGTTTPIAGVIVGVAPLAFPFARTDSAGRFELGGVSTGHSILTLEKDGWSGTGALDAWRRIVAERHRPDKPVAPSADPGAGLIVSILAPGHTVERTLSLFRTVRIRGRVCGPDGAAVAGARIRVRPDDGVKEILSDMDLLFVVGVAPTSSDDDGRFAIESPVSRGTLIVTARTRDCVVDARGTVDVGPNAPPAELVLQFPSTGAIEGRVVDAASGAPLVAAAVSWCLPDEEDGAAADEDAWQRSTSTDGEGRYRLEPVARGPVVVRARGRGALGTQERRTVEVVPGEATPDVDFALAPPLSISGRVLRGGGGANWFGADIEFRAADDAALAGRCQADPDGCFRIDGLVPGSYTLTAGSLGYAERSPPVVVLAGTDDVDIRFSPGLSIVGVARFADGSPAVGIHVTVTLDPGRREPWMPLPATTTDDGSFCLDGLFDRTCDIRVENSGLPRSSVVRPMTVRGVRAGTRGLVVSVEPALSVAGRVVASDGAALSEGEVICTLAGDVEAGADDAWSGAVHDGRFEIGGLPSGDLVARIYAPGLAATCEIVRAGDLDLVLHAYRSGTIRGHVRPLPGDGEGEGWVWVMGGGMSSSCGIDVDGSFVLTEVGPGPLRLGAQYEIGERRLTGTVDDVRLDEGATIEGVEIRLSDGDR